MAVEEHNACELTVYPAMHPLASEEWLGSCILAALADPRAVCELALVNKNFFLASNSNLVWQNLLPPTPHLKSLREECDDKALMESVSCSKREFYFRLCKSISLDGGLKRFWLDQRTGGECYMLSARSFSIARGSAPQYWQWLPSSGAWFPEVACLKERWWCYIAAGSRCWFDVSGRFRQLLKPGSYVVSCRMQMPCPSSWFRRPVKATLQNLTSARPLIKSHAFSYLPLLRSEPPLTSPLPPADVRQPSASDSHLRESDPHVWVESDLGRFTVEEGENGPTELAFSMLDVDGTDWKSSGWKDGFVLDGILIRPDYVVNAKKRRLAGSAFVYWCAESGDHQIVKAAREHYRGRRRGRMR